MNGKPKDIKGFDKDTIIGDLKKRIEMMSEYFSY